MEHPRFSWSPAPALACAALLLASATGAAAQDVECETDADCGHGFVCEKGSFEFCPAIDAICDESGECPAPPPCEPTEYASCVLAPCEQDADCPDGLTCASSTYESCDYPEPTCVDGAECTKPEPQNCETVEDRYCAAPWELPCEQDSDCGEGFSCVELESCWCSGSTGSADSGGSSDPAAGGGESADGGTPDATPDCGCEPSGEFWCEQHEIACSDDAECPSGWECTDNPVRPVCSAPMGDGSGDTTTDCGGADLPERTCQPPYYSQGGGRFVTLEAGTASDTGGALPPSVNTAAGAGDDGAAPEASEGSPKGSSGGCSVSSAGAASGQLAWLALPLLALGRTRRRRAR